MNKEYMLRYTSEKLREKRQKQEARKIGRNISKKIIMDAKKESGFKLKKTGKHVDVKKEMLYYLFKRIGTGEKFGAKARTAKEARNIINRRTFAPKYKLKLIKKSKLKL